MKQSCYVILILILTSCTSDADFNIPANRGKLVLNSLITPSEPISVDISASVPITQGYYPEIKDATVLLYENGVFIDTLTYMGDRKYETGYMPQVGAAYTLVVEAPGYNPIRATDIVPASTMKAENATGFSFEYPTVTKNGYVTGTLDFDLTDDSQAGINYYDVQILEKWWGTIWQRHRLFVSNEVLSQPEDLPYPSSLLFTNKVFQGKTVHFSVFVGSLNRPIEFPAIKFRKVSLAYYEYKNTWYLHDYYKIWRGGENDDYFRGDPTKMFTNVEGGYGIFAAYSEFMYEP